MRKLFPPMVTTAVTMVLVGVLVGYTGTAFVGTLVADSGLLPGSTGEAPEAHKFVLAFLKHESDSLQQLRPQRDVLSRALDKQMTEQQQQTAGVKPVSVTYIGGASAGRYSVHLYAVEVKATNGRSQFMPLALTLVGGKVVRLD